MTIHLVDSAPDEDSFLAVADYAANIINAGQAKTALAETPGSVFLSEIAVLLQNQNFDGYLTKMTSQLDLVLSSAESSIKDCECMVNVLVHSVARLPADRVAPACKEVVATLTSKVDEKGEVRLGGALNIYGALHAHPAAQRAVLLLCLDYSRKAPQLARVLAPAVRGKSGEWIKGWALDEPAARELLVALAQLVKVGTDRASVKEYWRLVNHALGMCKEGDVAAVAQLRPLAVAAITDFIRSPTAFQADFAASPAVRALGADASAKAVYALFSAVLSGDLKALKAAATQPALDAVGLGGQGGQDAVASKARLVALLALCGGKVGGEEVTFAAIQSALEVGPSEVEGWLVRAIGAKLLEGRIDQVRGVVTVTRATQRTFGASEWAALAGQLAGWRDSIKGVRAMLATQAATSGVAAPASAAPPARPVRA
uniref:PCI domain-containing protein n=1 Tax=Chlamydomonas leiostraca TaxID=1034604 RepID=A0A7S0WQZ1_9CHLO|mmetsp:Transcript_23326/g.59682  ORF Transcript_23326/g.59682 Transcript_23326/m.59682 type:complete len:429 (+) Transcript_23326:137-1423(+)|eukprot:CAMPEP_0202867414 /NCGR_PEP_ID=MMETSP1391-20130828/9375_1 /ASSEMBLY_ACC=CAM_ASM_000867 /TAXON_ID=1034604 /ORGANISM="Chlamydomonas leiostraca, Strain SAG 11-49" /LENGTH=428 /DNA_ID=CAMNT_0049547457 /DNA_START=135 /DNA_END=1421 /DNA_ORIENTATION=-